MQVNDFLIMDDSMIMGYGESDTSGCWLKLQMLPEHLETLRGLKGEQIELAIKLLDNSGNPVELKTPNGHLCITAIELCKDNEFQDFCIDSTGFHLDDHVAHENITDEEFCKYFILKKCGVTSRKELDSNVEAQKLFAKMRTAFAQWKRENI